MGKQRDYIMYKLVNRCRPLGGVTALHIIIKHGFCNRPCRAVKRSPSYSAQGSVPAPESSIWKKIFSSSYERCPYYRDTTTIIKSQKWSWDMVPKDIRRCFMVHMLGDRPLELRNIDCEGCPRNVT